MAGWRPIFRALWRWAWRATRIKQLAMHGTGEQSSHPSCVCRLCCWLQTSDFRLQRHKFKQDCRKSKPILVGLRSCRWEVWGITSRKGREKKKKQSRKKSRKNKGKQRRISIVDGLYFKMWLEKLLKSIDWACLLNISRKGIPQSNCSR